MDLEFSFRRNGSNFLGTNEDDGNGKSRKNLNGFFFYLYSSTCVNTCGANIFHVCAAAAQCAAAAVHYFSSSARCSAHRSGALVGSLAIHGISSLGWERKFHTFPISWCGTSLRVFNVTLQVFGDVKKEARNVWDAESDRWDLARGAENLNARVSRGVHENQEMSWKFEIFIIFPNIDAVLPICTFASVSLLHFNFIIYSPKWNPFNKSLRLLVRFSCWTVNAAAFRATSKLFTLLVNCISQKTAMISFS